MSSPSVAAEESAYLSLVPARLLETRAGFSTVDGQFNAIGLREAGSETALVVADRGGVPANAKAVVINLAVTGSGAGGFVTVWPCGQQRPLASSLNHAAGQTISNAVTARIGAGGAICIFVLAATHVIVDVTGAYPSTSAFEALVPGRVLDTRAGATTVDGIGAGQGILGAGTITPLPVRNRAGTGSADAVVVNLAVTGSSAAGFVTIFPCGSERPNAASLNHVAGQTISNAVTAKVGDNGSICIFVFSTTHVIVDVTGAFSSSAGYTSLVPGRILETRAGFQTVDGRFNGIGQRGAGSDTPVVVAGRAGVGLVDAVVLNLAVTGSSSPGFVTIYPCGSQRPNASSLNFAAGETISNAVTAKVGSDGRICVYVFAATHVIVDVTGFFPGAIAPDPTLPDVPAPPKPKLQAVYVTATDSAITTYAGEYALDLQRAVTWYVGQLVSIGKQPDFVRNSDGSINVISHPLTTTSAQVALTYRTIANQIRTSIVASGNFPVILFEGRAGLVCGETHSDGYVWIGATNCPIDRGLRTQFPDMMLGFPYLFAHEIAHALVGVGTSCDASYVNGHEIVAPNDILYAGPLQLQEPTLDVGKDDYFGNPKQGCPNLANSPLLT